MEIDVPRPSPASLPTVAPIVGSPHSHDTANYVQLRLAYESFSRDPDSRFGVVSTAEAKAALGPRASGVASVQ